MSEMGCVYLLTDPRTSEVKYVGATKDPDRRYYQHLKERYYEDMRDWVAELEEQDKTPNMCIVAWDELDDLGRVEGYWMDMLKDKCNLLNNNTSIKYDTKRFVRND